MQNYDEKKIFHFMKGSHFQEQYFLNGKFHRTDRPSLIEYINGIIRHEDYHINGKRHRINKPAYISRNSQGKEGLPQFYLDGVNHSEQIHKQIVQEALALPPALRLTDPRWWVRELKEEDIENLRNNL